MFPLVSRQILITALDSTSTYQEAVDTLLAANPTSDGGSESVSEAATMRQRNLEKRRQEMIEEGKRFSCLNLGNIRIEIKILSDRCNLKTISSKRANCYSDVWSA